MNTGVQTSQCDFHLSRLLAGRNLSFYLYSLAIVQLAILFSLLLGLFSPVFAYIVPTSQVALSDQECRIDFFHLERHPQQNSFLPVIQIAMVSTKQTPNRYIAIKRALRLNSHLPPQHQKRRGYENIEYRRARKPVAVFTTYWQPLTPDSEISGLVILGDNNYQKAFDRLTNLLFQDAGHFELATQGESFQFYAQEDHLTQFQACLR